MAEIRLIYLFKFLEDHSRFFTSAAFFGVLLALTLFIDPSPNLLLNSYISVLQSSSLALFILCLMTLVYKLQKSEAIILKIYSFLTLLVILGLLGYLWYQYNGVILWVLILAFIALGYFIINKVAKKINLLLQKKFKFRLKDLVYYLLFFLVLFFNFYLIYQMRWGEFVSVVDINSLTPNLSKYMFIGFGIWLISKIPDIIDFLKKKRPSN